MDRSAVADLPFVPASSTNNNAQFSAAKMNNNKSSIKPPKAPEKPLMPYMRYSRKVWDQVKAANKDSKLWEIGRIIGQMWRELPAEEKQEHINDYELEKEQYAELLKAYQNSPAYQQYLASKEKAAQAEQRQRDMEIVGIGTNGVLVGTKPKGGPFNDSQNVKVESRLTIPQVESEMDISDGDAVSTRRLAALRYQRNQRLLHEVFNDSCVPDVRGVVTAPRMKILKRQIESLSMHQQKLEEELRDLETQFQEKKRRLETARDDFVKDWDKICFDSVSKTTYDEMVQKATEKLAKDYEVYKAAQEAKEVAAAVEMAAESSPSVSSAAQPEEEAVSQDVPLENQDAPLANQEDDHSASNGHQNGLDAAESNADTNEK